MAAAIVSTVGGTTSNCYVASIAAANLYYETRLNVSAWDDLVSDEDEQTRALIQATRWLDTATFEGVKVASGQALKFPRYGATDDDGYEYDTATIPNVIQHATLELALALLVAGTTDVLANSGLEQFENVKVGPLDVTPRITRGPNDFPQHVKDMLKSVLTNAGMSARTDLA